MNHPTIIEHESLNEARIVTAIQNEQSEDSISRTYMRCVSRRRRMRYDFDECHVLSA